MQPGDILDADDVPDGTLVCTGTALTDRIAVLQERVAADLNYTEALSEQVKRDGAFLRCLADLIRRPQ